MGAPKILKAKALVIGCIMTIFVINISQCGVHSKTSSTDNMELVIQTDKAIYQSSEPVKMCLTITNRASQPLTLHFSTAQQYDFVVKKQGIEVWRWSRGRMFAMMLTDVTLKPNQSLVYEESWQQKDAEGNHVPPGKYEVIGLLTSYPGRTSQSLYIEIQ